MSTYIENFKRFRPLLNELVSRDIKIKSRRCIMGVLCTLLNPLLMMIVLSIVFSNLFKFDIENFPLYLLSGQVIFNFYSDSTNNAMGAIIFNAPLIKKVYVPKYLFVVSRVVSSFINLMAAFTALLFVMVATRAELHWTATGASGDVFSGSFIVSFCGSGKVPGYYAFLFCVYYSINVSDTCYLSHVYFASVDEICGIGKSYYQLSDYVPGYHAEQ